VLSTMERDVALFRRTKNMVEPRFRVQGRGEALVARCRRCSAMLSELRFTIVTDIFQPLVVPLERVHKPLREKPFKPFRVSERSYLQGVRVAVPNA